MRPSSFSIDSPPTGPTVSHAALFMLLAFLSGPAACRKSPPASELRPAGVSSNPTPALAVLPQPTVTPGSTPGSTPAAAPSGAEVVAAIARVFNSAATADRDGAPNFVVGDFNGDGAEDVAVVTKPNEAALPEINHELANWTLEDPREVTAAAAKTGNPSARPKAVKAERNDRLLAIIHGIGPQGWRHPEARQAFLLRNAAGTNVTVQMARPPESPANSNSQLHGDAISETLNGQRGFIFWTGAKYAWAPQR